MIPKGNFFAITFGFWLMHDNLSSFLSLMLLLYVFIIIITCQFLLFIYLVHDALLLPSTWSSILLLTILLLIYFECCVYFWVPVITCYWYWFLLKWSDPSAYPKFFFGVFLYVRENLREFWDLFLKKP